MPNNITSGDFLTPAEQRHRDDASREDPVDRSGDTFELSLRLVPDTMRSAWSGRVADAFVNGEPIDHHGLEVEIHQPSPASLGMGDPELHLRFTIPVDVSALTRDGTQQAIHFVRAMRGGPALEDATARQALQHVINKAATLRSRCDQADPEQREAARNLSRAISDADDAGMHFTRGLAHKLGVQAGVDLELVGAAGARPERARFVDEAELAAAIDDVTMIVHNAVNDGYPGPTRPELAKKVVDQVAEHLRGAWS